MTVHSSVTVEPARVLSPRAGLLWGLLGVVAFSFTVPLTRVATGGFSPLFIGSAR
ncbi:MAG: EamA family transporter, partial [Actinomycetes bacterium]